MNRREQPGSVTRMAGSLLVRHSIQNARLNSGGMTVARLSAMMKSALAVVVSSILLSGCGGNSATAPSGIGGSTKTIVASGSYAATARFSHFVAFSTSASGQLDISVKWGKAANDLTVDVVLATCTSDQYVAGACQFLYDDQTQGASSKTHSMGSFAPGSYMLIIDNHGPADEAVSYEIDLTS